jgi:ABC-type nitrate/sulfonate/bicarbonate transport system substrate-binding protein
MVRAGTVSLTRWSAYVLLLFNQLIRFVNGDIRSFSFARAGGYAIISRPDIATVKDLKGKRLAINTFGSSADLW